MFFSELGPTINASTHQKSTTKETPRSNSILAIDCSSRALLPLLSAYFTGNFQLCIKNSGNDENFIDSAITDLYIEHIIYSHLFAYCRGKMHEFEYETGGAGATVCMFLSYCTFNFSKIHPRSNSHYFIFMYIIINISKHVV